MSDKKSDAPKPAEGAAPAAGGGLKALLPLLLNVVLMPVMAYVMTVFVLLPKINSGSVAAHAKTVGGEAVAAPGAHGEPADKGASGKHGGGAGGKIGPDLTSIGASAPPDYLVESLLYPNAKIKEGYHSVLIATKDGKVDVAVCGDPKALDHGLVVEQRPLIHAAIHGEEYLNIGADHLNEIAVA